MAKSWNSQSEYRTLSGELAVSEDLHFERKVMPLLRIIWPEFVGTPARRSFDRKGIDHIVWGDVATLPLVVQCKGFHVPEHELGTSQVQQCLGSIDSFKNSNCKAETYLLIHNRSGQHEGLRNAVTAALNELVKEKRAERALLWDRQQFLNSVFNAMLARVESYVTARSSVFSHDFFESFAYEPIHETPLQTSVLHADQYRMVAATVPQKGLKDPSVEIFDFDSCNMTLLLGEAGYGKTTAVLRSLTQTDKKIFYLPASTISSDITGSKQLLATCIRLDELFTDVAEEYLLTHQAVARPIIEYLLKNENLPVVLVLDALDESIYFSRRGGIQTLFNQLRDVKVPVVLTARSEFWAKKMQDFQTSFGLIASKTTTPVRNKHVKLIDLLPWTDHEIVELAARYRATLADQAGKERISSFIDLVKNGTYQEIYRDIPRRPLFLKLILDTVAAQEVRKTGIAKLFYDWAHMKVLRDINEPMRWGGVGREAILNEKESSDETLALSFAAMMNAAARMTEMNDGELQLLPDCVFDDIVLADDRFRGLANPTGLFLNSLLVPVPQAAHKRSKIRFGHRAYQEFFLALYIYENPMVFNGVKLPEPVEDFLSSIRGEGI